MPKWTVMVFMGTDTIEGRVPLDAAADADLREIAKVGGSPDLNVFVQRHHSRRVTQHYHFGWEPGRAANPGKPFVKKRPLPEATPGDSLIPFVRDSLLAVDHQAADYSLLVLWGHAYDFAFGHSRTRGGVIDAIDFIELSEKLRNLQDLMRERYRALGSQNADLRPTLDIIGFDACDAATIELSCQLQPFTKFLLGSQIGIPIPGWPYDRILDRLIDPKGEVMSPPELGSYIVRRFCESYTSQDPVSLTLINMATLASVRRHTGVLALALATAIGRASMQEQLLRLFKRSQTAEGRPFVDVADLCLNLYRESGHPFVAASAKALGNQLVGPRPPLVSKSKDGARRPLIAEFGRNAGELARLNGISLYAPHVAPENDGAAVRSVYNSFSLARDTRWGRVVHALADL